MQRLMDIMLAAIGLVLTFPFMLILITIGLFDTASPLFTQVRIGRHQKHFTIVKLRTMVVNTESVATHLVQPASVTKWGAFLRRTKLDELPQLWNVIKGDMSLVGPRPCLPNQLELIAERSARKVFDMRPGVTGLAQIQGIDMSTPQLLAETDAKMLDTLTLSTYFKYLSLTITGSGHGDRVRSQ